MSGAAALEVGFGEGGGGERGDGVRERDAGGGAAGVVAGKDWGGY